MVGACACRKEDEGGAAETDVFGTWDVRRSEGSDDRSDVTQ
jgi:hypothetical protein